MTESATSRSARLRELLISLAVLAVPMAAAALLPRALADYEALLWLLALVPGFLLAYERGLRGVATALAFGMAVLSLTYLVLHLTGHPPPRTLWAVVLVYVAATLGAGALVERVRAERQKRDPAAHLDPQTGLPDRRYAELHLEREIAAAARGRPLSVVLLRVEVAAEGRSAERLAAALRSAARRLGSITRRMNVTARYDERTFLCLLGGCDEEGALGFSRRARTVLREEGPADPPLPVSVGVACYRPSQRGVADLLDAAERALEEGVREGGDRLRVAARAVEPPAPPEAGPTVWEGGAPRFAPRRVDPPPVGLLGRGRRALVFVRDAAARERLARELRMESFQTAATGDLADGIGEVDVDVLFADLGAAAAAAYVADVREHSPITRIVGVAPAKVRDPRELFTTRLDAYYVAESSYLTFRPQLAELLAERDWIRAADSRVQQLLAEVRATARESREATRHSEEMLQRSQKMDAVGRLAGGIAHDFNNLLTTVRGHVELLMEDLPEADPMRSDLVEIREATTRATGLTRQLLTFTSRRVGQPRMVDLGAAVQEMERMLRRVIGENIELETILGEGDLHVKADGAQLDQIILNLAVNARDAMPDGGRLHIAVDGLSLRDPAAHGVELPAGEYVRLRVRDTGPGMDAALRARIFEPFFTTKGPNRGTGLGLSTVQGIVRQGGGEITVESEPGAGTTFIILLPRAREPLALPRSRNGTGAAAPPASGTPAILLVEDEDAVRRLVGRILGEAGRHVIVAPTPALGLEILARDDARDGAIALLISDLVMPGMDGVELARRARAMRPTLPILFVSGYGEEAVARHDLPADAAILEKPFTPRELEARVRALLAGSETA